MKRFSIGLMFLASLALSAQELQKMPVKNGAVEIRSIRFPVYSGVQEVKGGAGILYEVGCTPTEKCPLLVEKIRKFYQGQKIGAFTIALKNEGGAYVFHAGEVDPSYGDLWGKGAYVQIMALTAGPNDPNPGSESVYVTVFPFDKPEGP